MNEKEERGRGGGGGVEIRLLFMNFFRYLAYQPLYKNKTRKKSSFILVLVKRIKP